MIFWFRYDHVKFPVAPKYRFESEGRKALPLSCCLFFPQKTKSISTSEHAEFLAMVVFSRAVQIIERLTFVSFWFNGTIVARFTVPVITCVATLLLRTTILCRSYAPWRRSHLTLGICHVRYHISVF